MAKTKSRWVSALAAVLAALAFWRRRRKVGGGPRRPDGCGGPAGVREPRRPVPPVLTSVGAPMPESDPR